MDFFKILYHFMCFKYFGYFWLFIYYIRPFSVIFGYLQLFCRSVLGNFFLFSTVGYLVGRLFNRPTTNKSGNKLTGWLEIKDV